MININDSPPKLSQDTYETVLLLPTYMGVEVLQVEAFDPDAASDFTLKSVKPQLVYSLVESSVENFSVDRYSGTVTVVNPNFNKERYQFTVKVGTIGFIHVWARLSLMINDHRRANRERVTHALHTTRGYSAS